MFRNFIIHQNFLEFLQPLRDGRNTTALAWQQTTGLTVLSWFPLYLFGLAANNGTPVLSSLQHNGLHRYICGSFMWFLGILLAWFTTGCSVRSSTLVDTVTGEMSLSIRFSRSRVSLPLDVTVGDEDELEEDVEQ